MTSMKKVLEKAQECIGMKESPSNSNNILFNTVYYGKAVNGSAYPWCCVFLYWVFLNANAGHLFYDGKKTALCATLGNWFKSRSQFFSTPKVGDVVFFKTSRTKNWTNHVGIVEAINSDNTITTIEGNTAIGNEDNGGAVMRRTRALSGKDCFIVGFGRPAYSDVGTTPTISTTPLTLNYPCKGVDVSGYQKNINYSMMKQSGVKFAILKIIRKDLNIDKLFEQHYKGFTQVGIPVICVYNYSYATTVEKARSDAQMVIKHLGNRAIPVCLDVEDKCQQGLGSKLIDIINAYQEVINAAGLKFCIYTGLSFYNCYIRPYLSQLKCKDFWIARYYQGYNTMQIIDNQTPDPAYRPKLDDINLFGWQYTSSGRVGGYDGNLDANLLYSPIVQNQGHKEEIKDFGIKAYCTAANSLNVRKAPIKGDVLGVLKHNQEIVISGFDAETGWLSIGKDQWVSPKYIDSKFKGKVTANSLRIRSEDNTNGEPLGIYTHGQVVILLAQSKTGWFLTPNGWVSNKYIQII